MKAAQSQPDGQFLLWILTGLIAATIGSGIVAMALAMTIPGIP
jgi:hypothetical protein